MSEKEFYVHPTAICDSNAVGPGTNIWAFCHVMDGAKIGSNTNIGNNTFIESGAQIGNDVTIKNNVLIWEGISIEDQVFVGPAVSFVNDMYPRSPRGNDPTIQDRYRDKSGWLVKTRVEAGASIGASVVIAPGVTLGRYCTVAAGSVVIKDIKDHALVAGNPAHQIKWVCVCGLPLEKSESNEYRCHCGQTYQLVESGLKKFS